MTAIQLRNFCNNLINNSDLYNLSDYSASQSVSKTLSSFLEDLDPHMRYADLGNLTPIEYFSHKVKFNFQAWLPSSYHYYSSLWFIITKEIVAFSAINQDFLPYYHNSIEFLIRYNYIEASKILLSVSKGSMPGVDTFQIASVYFRCFDIKNEASKLFRSFFLEQMILDEELRNEILQDKYSSLINEDGLIKGIANHGSNFIKVLLEEVLELKYGKNKNLESNIIDPERKFLKSVMCRIENLDEVIDELYDIVPKSWKIWQDYLFATDNVEALEGYLDKINGNISAAKAWLNFASENPESKAALNILRQGSFEKLLPSRVDASSFFLAYVEENKSIEIMKLWIRLNPETYAFFLKNAKEAWAIKILLSPEFTSLLEVHKITALNSNHLTLEERLYIYDIATIDNVLEEYVLYSSCEVISTFALDVLEDNIREIDNIYTFSEFMRTLKEAVFLSSAVNKELKKALYIDILKLIAQKQLEVSQDFLDVCQIFPKNKEFYATFNQNVINLEVVYESLVLEENIQDLETNNTAYLVHNILWPTKSYLVSTVPYIQADIFAEPDIYNIIFSECEVDKAVKLLEKKGVLVKDLDLGSIFRTLCAKDKLEDVMSFIKYLKTSSITLVSYVKEAMLSDAIAVNMPSKMLITLIRDLDIDVEYTHVQEVIHRYQNNHELIRFFIERNVELYHKNIVMMEEILEEVEADGEIFDMSEVLNIYAEAIYGFAD